MEYNSDIGLNYRFVTIYPIHYFREFLLHSFLLQMNCKICFRKIMKRYCYINDFITLKQIIVNRDNYRNNYKRVKIKILSYKKIYSYKKK